MSIVRYVDRILPTQDFGSRLFDGSGSMEDRLYDVLTAFSAPFSADDLELDTPGHIGMEEMTTPPNQLAFFNALVKISGANRILEIGTFIGKTAMRLAQMVGDGGHVTTIEAVDSFAAMASNNFQRNGFADKITLLRGDAGPVLDRLRGNTFDFIFIDGSKQNYLAFALKALNLISPTGVILVDDIFFHGDALNSTPSTDKGRGCKETLEYFRNFDGCSKAVVPAWNGALLLFGFHKAAE
ncbi:MAG TPA: class I SAM-dependent methyltransferase [Pseudolabrys sp.]|nr:class I SAM-dependent methyltransferase [Pseudolabrys sp.]